MNLSRPYGTLYCSRANPALKRRAIGVRPSGTRVVVVTPRWNAGLLARVPLGRIRRARYCCSGPGCWFSALSQVQCHGGGRDRSLHPCLSDSSCPQGPNWCPANWTLVFPRLADPTTATSPEIPAVL